MRKTTIYLDTETHDRVRRLSEATGRTQADVIREAIARYTTGEQPLPRSLGLGRSGIEDLADRAEELLDGMGEDR